MSKAYLKAIKVLEHIIATKGGDSSTVGLCMFIDHLLPKPTLDQLFRSWSEYSGNPVFPVPSMSKDLSPGQAYMRLGVNKYEGAYGEARLRLAQFIVDELRKGIDLEIVHDK